MDDSTEKRLCGICLEIFQKPKIIPCFHTFCQECLNQHIKAQSQRGTFSCPICRNTTTVPVGGASKFMNNFYIDQVDDEQKCSCSQDIMRYYCRDCCLAYCSTCIIRNHRMHNIVELTDFNEEIKESLTGLKDELQKEIDILQSHLDDIEFESSGMISAREVAYEKIDAVVNKKCLEIREKSLNLKKKIESLCRKQYHELEIHKNRIVSAKIYLLQLKRTAEESLGEFTISAKEIIPEIENALQDQGNKVCLLPLLQYPVFSKSPFDMNTSDDLGTLEMMSRGIYTAILKYLPESHADSAFQCSSPTFMLHNLNWTVQTNHHDDTKTLGIYICLNQVQCDEKLKSCIANFSIKLMNKFDDSKSVMKRFTADKILVGGLGKGWYKYVGWSEFVDPLSGFLDDLGNFTLIITNNVLENNY